MLFPSNTTVGIGSGSRLQWRYRGGFSPPSLFSLGGHLNEQWLYVGEWPDDMTRLSGSQGSLLQPSHVL